MSKDEYIEGAVDNYKMWIGKDMAAMEKSLNELRNDLKSLQFHKSIPEYEEALVKVNAMRKTFKEVKRII